MYLLAHPTPTPLHTRLQVARQEREALRAVHRAREAKILLLWALDPSGRRKEGLSQLGDGKDASTNPEQLRLNYGKTLDSLSQIWDKLDQRREAADERVDRLTAILDRHDERLTKLSEAFRRFKRDIAAESKHSRTGKHIARRRILALENDEEKADQDLAEARLKFINLKNQLTRLENQVKQKEELAEGLHLIDFEQLKIENATLHDQIEERHDQLHKLRRKTVTTAQILTHVKEKLQFVKQENKALKVSAIILVVVVMLIMPSYFLFLCFLFPAVFLFSNPPIPHSPFSPLFLPSRPPSLPPSLPPALPPFLLPPVLFLARHVTGVAGG